MARGLHATVLSVVYKLAFISGGLGHILYSSNGQIVGARPRQSLLPHLQNLVDQSLPITFQKPALGVLRPALVKFVSVGSRQVLFPFGFEFYNVLLFALGPKSLRPMKSPLVRGHIVAFDSPLLLIASA